MARFEFTISNGETVLVDHPAAGMAELVSALDTHPFLLATEIRVGSTAPPREVIIASTQVTLVRAADSDSRQSSTFRPKR
jgi:hypothetical protein